MLTPQLPPETVARLTAAYADTVAAIYAASTPKELAMIYEREVGYNPLDDEPNQTADELRSMLIDFQREACYANDIDCQAIGIRTDSDGVVYGTQGGATFEFDGATYGLQSMLDANPEDLALRVWLRHAAVGDAMFGCTRVE